MSRRETSSEIDDAAAAWAARVDRSPLPPAQQAALDAWLAEDSRRLGAYARARAVAAHTLRARALGPNYDPANFAAAPAAVDRRGISRRQLLISGGVAAAAAALAGIMIRPRELYSTKLGEVRMVSLADGSTVTLNTATRVEVTYAADSRRIRLLGGEALFDVAKDPARPFVVEAGGAQVRAVGTSFTVRQLDDHGIEVLVREGVVEMRHANAGNSDKAPDPVRLEANMRAFAPSAAAPIQTGALTAGAIQRETAWREGMIAFDGMTLTDAAQAFGRYSDTRIVIEDPHVGARTVTGLFAANNPIGFAQAVASSFELHAEVSENEVLIRK